MRKLIKNKQDMDDFIFSIKEEFRIDKSFMATFEVQRKQRSVAQNKLYWMWLRCIRADTGNDLDTLHEYFCDQYLPWNEEAIFDTTFRKRGGTSHLDTKEFTVFLECIKMEMMEKQNIYLPHPEDRGYDEFYSKYS